MRRWKSAASWATGDENTNCVFWYPGLVEVGVGGVGDKSLWLEDVKVSGAVVTGDENTDIVFLYTGAVEVEVGRIGDERPDREKVEASGTVGHLGREHGWRVMVPLDGGGGGWRCQGREPEAGGCRG